MDTLTTNSTESERKVPHAGNIGTAERVLSALAGAGLLASALRGRGVVGRLARGGAGVSLLARGASGYCPMKGAAQGDTSLGSGYKEQLRRLSSGVGQAVQRVRSRGAPQIDNMESMYRCELQELHSAENQMIDMLRELTPLADNARLAARLEQYTTDLQRREDELDELLANMEVEDRSGHPDQAIRALIGETHKMAAIAANTVRDSALAASVQRLIHYKIAGYGTIAAYAKSLGKTDQAAQFATMADHDRTIDAEISDLAKDILNPAAVIAPDQPQTNLEYTTH